MSFREWQKKESPNCAALSGWRIYDKDPLQAECTLFVTGEVKYHDAQDAARGGVTLIEGGHFYSEPPVLRRFVEWLYRTAWHRSILIKLCNIAI